MKHRVVLLLLLLVAGAIVNVAVAWAGSLPEPRLLVERSAIDDWPYSVPRHWPSRCRSLFQETGIWTIERYCGKFEVRDSAYYDIDIHSAGWPLRSHRADCWSEYEFVSPQFQMKHHYDGHPKQTIWFAGIVTETGWGVLPIRPIWPGFAINTVFYALVLWLLLAAPFALRRRRRIKRGLCPKCAYDLRGSKDATACPECGATVTSNARP